MSGCKGCPSGGQCPSGNDQCGEGGHNCGKDGCDGTQKKDGTGGCCGEEKEEKDD